MKNLFKSPVPSDLKIFQTFEIMQKQLRDLRDDNIQMMKQIRILVKGMAILVSSPEPEDSEEIPELEDK